MESKYFIYDGIKSSDMGLYLVRIDSGMVESPFFGGYTVNEEFVRNRNTSYFFGVEPETIEFTIHVSPLDRVWTPQLKYALGQWLVKGEYKKFQSSSDLGKIYYGIVTDAPNFNTYSKKGYIEITMKTNSPYAWSPVYYETYDLSDNENGTMIQMNNRSNVNKKFYPKIEIGNRSGETYKVVDGEKIYTSGIELINHSNKGKSFSIDGFESVDEVISIDNENEVILSDLHQSEPFKRFSRKWLELVPGVNQIEVKGKCEIWTKMQFPILQ